MRFSERIQSLGLPLDELVVIGSGLLDQLDLRAAGDIDLVVSQELFLQLKATAGYECNLKHGEECLEKAEPPLEIWCSWGSGGVPNFDELYAQGQTIDGVRFVATQTLIEQKRTRGLSKDYDDIALLEQYNKQYATRN